MNGSDGEPFVVRSAFDTTFTPGLESWALCSSLTIQGDGGMPSSEVNKDVLDHQPNFNERNPSTGSDSELITSNFVALRPLYSSVPQFVSKQGPQSGSDMKLAQKSRKGHRKSRQGCFNCKRRKIKCQETLPACDNCTRKELVCKYPTARAHSLLQACSEDLGSPIVPVQLQTTPIFNLVDMRFFHHFIFNAYPHLPVGNDAVWVRRVPAVAYHHEYLMHAILGLAASHLTVTTDADYSSMALSHRLLAIKGFNEALSKTQRTSSDGDALLAACYALTFQSANMKDGMSEFLTMVRGCGLVTLQLLSDQVDVSFSITPSRHIEYMASRLDNLPAIDADLYQGSVSSITAISSLCGDVEGLVKFHAAVQDCLETVGVDPRAGYFKYYLIYHTLGRMGQTQFRSFGDTSNRVCQLLMAHFVALEIMMAPIVGREWKGRVISTPMEGVLQWLNGICDGMPSDLRCFLSWPAAIASCIKAEMQGEQPPRPWLKEFFNVGLI